MTRRHDDNLLSVTVGTLLAGKYRVERVLGEGGMGVVLAATHEALRQRVAIKLVRSGALANAKDLGRFEREARAAASLRSEHVARVLDVGNLEDGRPYMVMEYLEGRDLGDVIEQGPGLPVGELVDYVLQACEAIAEAHAAGIIHRDLKPRNLFLATTVDGRPLVKVLDFGISKMEDSPDDLALTRTSEVIGSPSYMSPEQLRSSKGVDARTDIWALGVILYELLSRRLPFDAATITELVAVVLTDPTPDIRHARPDVPDGLAYAIQRCLAKPREERFSSVAELVGAIAPFGSGALAGIAERIARVAHGSARALPPSDAGSGPYAQAAGSERSGTGPTTPRALPVHPAGSQSGSDPGLVPTAQGAAPAPASSGRLVIHGGTSVAWAETQAGPSVARRSRVPVIAAMVLVVVLAGASTGAVVYGRRTGTAAIAVARAPAESAALPGPRNGGQPTVAPPATTPAPTTAIAVATSAVSSMRAAPDEGADRAPNNGVIPAGKVVPKPGAGPVSAPPAGAKPHDLSDIGRH